MNRLLDKTALITGAASGIGKAIAERFHREGARVIVTDVDDAGGIDVIARLGPPSHYCSLDVTREEDWKRLVAVVQERYGRLDVLVNNAGIGGYAQTAGPHDPEHLDLASWHQVHRVNLDGVALGCKYAIQMMKPHRAGSIVNISSRAAMIGLPVMAAYASSKAAVRNHTKTVALHCAQHGYNIRCNSVHPGAILTPMWDPMLGTGAERERALSDIVRRVPLGRMGSAEDVANAVLFLASDESSYVTGIELHVDGGLLAGDGPSTQEESAAVHVKR